MELTPVADEITLLRLAVFDIGLAQQAAIALRDAHDDTDPGLLLALETAVVVSYARPFTKSQGWTNRLRHPVRLDGAPVAAMEPLHNELLTLRGKAYAHSDADGSGRSVEHTDLQSRRPDVQPPYRVTWTLGLDRGVLPDVIALCQAQQDRFTDEADQLVRLALGDLTDLDEAI
jgi:hypothetical protein